MTLIPESRPDDPADSGPVAGCDDGAETEPPPALALEGVVESGIWSAPESLGRLLGHVAAALAAEPELRGLLPERATACVAFSSDDEVAALNARYRDAPKPTNVLSFPAGEPPSGWQAAGEPWPLGDIVLADQTVAREARELGIPVEHHITHLVVHGVLHLLGFDHEADAEAEAMEALERRILAELGVADPYCFPD